MKRLLLLAVTAVYSVGLYFFYLRYVPLVQSFQLVLAPLLFFVFLLTVLNLESGILFFVFIFPLINGLPYFFKIFENIPHAPTALVLFLFFFLGILMRAFIFDEKFNCSNQAIFKPMRLFSLMVVVSAVITGLRYANFFPFLTDTIFEFTTNIFGVSAGGAIMSVVLTSLNYLTGFAFFLIVFHVLRSKNSIHRIVNVLILSAVVSFGFGLFQLIFNKEFGNNLISINEGLINGTFKDALSFGVFIAMIAPIMLGAVLSRKGFIRLISMVSLPVAILAIFFTGSKSGLTCLFLALIVFVWFILRDRSVASRRGLFKFKNPAIQLMIIILVCLLIFSAMLAMNSKILKSSTLSRINFMFSEGAMDLMASWRGPLWDAAALMIKDYPLTGVGCGAYIIELPNYNYEFRSREVPQSAENYFLQVGAEFGVIGLILVFWIFIVIFLSIKRSFKAYEKTHPHPYVFLGASIGLSIYLVNIMFHTYIGSFEVKYMFWLLAAIVLFSLKETEKKGKKIHKPWLGKTFSFLLLILFGALFLWNSTHSLSLDQRRLNKGLINHFGFYEMEKTPEGIAYEWTKQNAGMTVDIKKPVMGIRIRASHPDIVQKPVHVSIYLLRDSFRERRLIDEIVLKNSDWVGRAYFLPNDVDQRRVLLFKVDRTWNPKKVLGVPDPRELGIAFGKIKFKGKDYLDSGKPVKFIQ